MATTRHIFSVGWENNKGVWLACSCGWITELGYDVPLIALTKAAEQHRKDPKAL